MVSPHGVVDVCGTCHGDGYVPAPRA